MYHIAYMSRATHRFEREELLTLCSKSSVRNRAAGITGLLVHDARRFIQVIEGDTVDVRQTMLRIAADRRHDKIAYIADCGLRARDFDGWALACVGFEKNLTSAQLLNDVTERVRGIADIGLMAIFIGFAKLAIE